MLGFGFALSESTMVNPRALPSAYLVRSCFSWTVLPALRLGSGLILHSILNSSKMMLVLPWFMYTCYGCQLPSFLASHLCCWLQPPLGTPIMTEDLGRWQGHHFELESRLKNTRDVACRQCTEYLLTRKHMLGYFLFPF